MSESSGRIKLEFHCPKCGKKFGKLPSWLKAGGAVDCPKCGHTFVEQPVLDEAKALAERLKVLGIT